MDTNNKIQYHNIGKIFYDMLRDPNSDKYSMTRIASFIGLILLTITVIMSLIVMWKNKVIDHVLLVELIGFILTLLGFKNSFGFNTTGNTQNATSEGNPDAKPAEPVNVKQLLTEVTNDIKDNKEK